MRLFLMLTLLVPVIGFVALAADKDTDTPAAAATRKKLKMKVTVDFKETAFSAAMEDLKEQADNLSIRPDTKGGVSQNQKITYQAKDKPVEDVLDGICSKYDMGYYVISQQNHAYNGSVWITRNKKERGYPEGKEPAKTATKDKEPAKDKTVKEDEPAKDKPGKNKPTSKDKAASKDKTKPDDKSKVDTPAKEPEPEDEGQKAERQATFKLKTIQGVIEDGKADKAIELCEELIKKFPNTKAAKEAKQLLEKLK